METPSIPSKLSILYLEIGRGHPFYIDGIIEALVRRGDIGLVRQQRDVFEIAHGLSALSWRLARRIYHTAPSFAVLGRVYHRIRHAGDYNRGGLAIWPLGRDIRRVYRAVADPVIVSHPMLVGILRGIPRLIYQHGELAVPDEALVAGAELVLVPTTAAAATFVRAGYKSEQVIVTGLCIEPSLVKQASDAFRNRLQRMDNHLPLTGSYFSSGAEPKAHVEAIIQAATSSITDGHRAIIFAARDGRLARAAIHTYRNRGLSFCRLNAAGAEYPPSFQVVLAEHDSRREETALTARLFPLFDFLVAPAHERANWALGLGLPMLILEPCFGTFAPINRQILLDHAVACDLDERNRIRSFGSYLNSLRSSGSLQQMAQSGWGRYSIYGFDVIAGLLERRYA